MVPEHRQRAPYPHASSSTTDLPKLEARSPTNRSNPALPTQPPLWNSTSPTIPWSNAPPLQPAWNAESPSRPTAPFSLFILPSYSTIRFVSLCALWYTSSAVSSNTGKVILNRFPFPVTLTIVQFFFVAACSIICSRKELGWTARLRDPTKAIIKGTLPMAAFQVGGHILSSLAISRVPVSTVHTIKALSPLFTVAAYAFLFGVSYSPGTYLSLLPLTIGVMLAMSADITFGNVFGLICAFGSTLVFVSQNIFFKKIMPTNSEISTGPKLDKINLLFFSSGTAFVLMIPVWAYSDAARMFSHQGSLTTGPVVTYFILNGTVHFAQNILAFTILSSTSPVTYSIASLVKRIAVICLAFVWFSQSVHSIQAVGIGLTGFGLYMYNNAKRDIEQGEKRLRQVEAMRDGALPLNHNSVLLEKDVHVSPKPLPTADYPPVSKSTAVRAGTFQLPPSRISKPPVVEGPYPSPPASASSSPPSETQPLPRLKTVDLGIDHLHNNIIEEPKVGIPA